MKKKEEYFEKVVEYDEIGYLIAAALGFLSLGCIIDRVAGLKGFAITLFFAIIFYIASRKVKWRKIK